ncbi:MAG: nucleoside triphosphate pyrophosphohydrolase [Gammaproteobacteria bacterium]
MAEPSSAIARLLGVMARLRNPDGGCPWDLEQTFATIAPFTIEEAYEVADAIDSGDPLQLRDELGDLLFQVVFHARMAEERGWFDFDAVAAAIHDKLVRRHPHVFAGTRFATDALRSANWEDQKAQERDEAAKRRGADAASVLGDIPRALPALARAAKLGKRASRVGFDWPDAAGIREKVNEELGELDAAVTSAEADAVTEELGDTLFTLVNLGRKLHVDAEEALRAANRKFERRFKHMESLAQSRGQSLEGLSPAQWQELWLESKRALKSAQAAGSSADPA